MPETTTNPAVKLRTPAGPISLRSKKAFSSPKLEVDRENRVMKNVSIISAGPALGHDFLVDAKMLGQVVEKVNAKPKGIKSRLTHPGIPDCGGKDGIETTMGRVKNARLEDDQVMGDVQFSKFASKNPAGDLPDYVMSIAEEDPEICGLSIVFDPDEFEEAINPDWEDGDPEDEKTFQLGRVKDVSAADFVGDPAANAGGLSSAWLLSHLPVGVLSRMPRSFLDRWVESLLSLTHNPPAPEKPAPAITFSGVPNMDPKLLALLVAIGLSANPTVEQAKAYLAGLNSQQKTMLRKLCEGAAVPIPSEAIETPAPSTTQIVPKQELSADDQLVAAQAALGERLKRLAAVYGLDDQWTKQMLAKGVDMTTALLEAQKALAEKNKSIKVPIGVGADNAVTGLNEAISDAIILRSRSDAHFYEIHPKLADRISPKEGQLKRDALKRPIPREPSARAHEFVGLRLTDMVRVYFSTLGLDVNSMGPVQLATLAFDRPRLHGLFSARGIGLAEGIGDLPGVLVDAINKSLRIAYAETESTWEMWCRRSTAVDFKNIHRVQLSAAPSLLAVPTGGEFTRGIFKDADQQTALQVYGKIIGLYRQTLINDDTDAFGRIPMLIGSACRRLENDLVYNLFLLNSGNGPTMAEDANPLFNAAHSNLAGSGLALNVASLGAAKAAMRKQQAINPDKKTKARLNLIPRALLVPAELETIADQLTGSDTLIVNNTSSGTSQSQGDKNPVKKWNLQTVVEPRLSDQSAVSWYLAASPSQIDTCEMIFLEGEPEPVLLERDGWNIDGRDYKYRHTLQPVFIDFRGMYKNPGA
jgi:hypothetical protein